MNLEGEGTHEVHNIQLNPVGHRSFQGIVIGLGIGLGMDVQPKPIQSGPLKRGNLGLSA